jgi:hypothetical protein
MCQEEIREMLWFSVCNMKLFCFWLCYSLSFLTWNIQHFVDATICYVDCTWLLCGIYLWIERGIIYFSIMQLQGFQGTSIVYLNSHMQKIGLINSICLSILEVCCFFGSSSNNQSQTDLGDKREGWRGRVWSWKMW